jgi:hypothetical protein
VSIVKNSGLWTDWLIPLIAVSGVLLIFKEGIALTIVLWFFYLRTGWLAKKKHPSEENIWTFTKHLIIGIVVVIASFAFLIYASSN